MKIEKPATDRLGQIGKLIIGKKLVDSNYEKAFVKVIGKEEDKSKDPKITIDQIHQVLLDINVKLTKELNTELQDYHNKMSAGSSSKK